MSKQKIEFTLGFKADTAQAQRELETLAGSLKKLATVSEPTISDKKFKEASNAALELQQNLQSAFNVDTGKLDIGKFNNNLRKSGKQLSDYQKKLAYFGPTGEKAFNQLTRSIAQAEVPQLRLNKHLSNFLTTLKNTAKWQLSSNITHALESGLRSAVVYTEQLDKSLNNIRIVTGASAEQMAKFAQEANESARKLNATTTQYTDASLIYYQQGLSDKEVKERTDVTMKMASVTGQSVETISDQLTAIWNNFDDGSKSLEYYADVLTKLGADTASSSDEIVQGLQKFSAVADTIGLSYEYAAASLATITATTRESADVVGTALKTLFSRIQGLKLGETLEDGVDLNKYSEALDKVGVKILDQNGELREMDTILDDLGSRWNSLGKQQQTALAQTVAGVRQYTQLIALMDNWDFMQQNVQRGMSSEGTLTTQFEISVDSVEGSKNELKASLEGIADSILNEKMLINFNKFLTGLAEGAETVVDLFGGLPGIITTISSLLLMLFAKNMPNLISKMGMGFKSAFGIARKETMALQNEAQMAIKNRSNVNMSQSEKLEQQQLNTILTLKQRLLAVEKTLTNEEREAFEVEIQRQDLAYEQAIQSAKELERQEAITQELQRQLAAAAKEHLQDDDTLLLQDKEQARLEAEAAVKAIKQTKIGEVYYKNKTAPTATDWNVKEFEQAIKDNKSYQKNEKDLKEVEQAIKAVIKAQEKYNALLRQTPKTYNQKAAQQEINSVKDSIYQHEKLRITLGTLGQASEQWTEASGQDLIELKSKLQSYMQTNQELVQQSGSKAIQDQWKKLGELLNDPKADLQQILDLIRSIDQASDSNSQWHSDFSANIDEKKQNIINKYKFNDEEAKVLDTALTNMWKNGEASAFLGEKTENLGKDINKLIGHTTTAGEAMSQMTSHFMTFGMALTGITNIVDTFNNENSTWIDKLTAILSLVSTLGFTFGSLRTSVMSFANMQKTATVDTATMTAQLVKQGVAMEVAEDAAKKYTVAMKAAKTASWVLVAIELAIAGATMFFTNRMNEIKKEIEAAKKEAEKAKEEAEALRQKTDNNNNLVKEMDRLLTTEEAFIENKERLVEITEQLGEAYDIEETAIVNLTGKYEDYRDLLYEIKQAKLDDLKLELQSAQSQQKQQSLVIKKSDTKMFSGDSGMDKVAGFTSKHMYLDNGVIYEGEVGGLKNLELLQSMIQEMASGGNTIDYSAKEGLRQLFFASIEDTEDNRVKLYEILSEWQKQTGQTYFNEYINALNDMGVEQYILNKEYIPNLQIATGDYEELANIKKSLENVQSVADYNEIVNEIIQVLSTNSEFKLDDGTINLEKIDKVIANLVKYSSNGNLDQLRTLSKSYDYYAKKSDNKFTSETLSQWIEKNQLSNEDILELLPQFNWELVFNEEDFKTQLNYFKILAEEADLLGSIDIVKESKELVKEDGSTDWQSFRDSLKNTDIFKDKEGKFDLNLFKDFMSLDYNEQIKYLDEFLVQYTSKLELIPKELKAKLIEGNGSIQEALAEYTAMWEEAGGKKTQESTAAEKEARYWANIVNQMKEASEHKKNLTISFKDENGIEQTKLYKELTEAEKGYIQEQKNNADARVKALIDEKTQLEALKKWLNNEITDADFKAIIYPELAEGALEKLQEKLAQPIEVQVVPVLEGRFLQSDAIIAGIQSKIDYYETKKDKEGKLNGDEQAILNNLYSDLQTAYGNKAVEASEYAKVDREAFSEWLLYASSFNDQDYTAGIKRHRVDTQGRVEIDEGVWVKADEFDEKTGTYKHAQAMNDLYEKEIQEAELYYRQYIEGQVSQEEAEEWIATWITPLKNEYADFLTLINRAQNSTTTAIELNTQAQYGTEPPIITWEPPSDFSYTIRDRFASYDEAVEKSLDEFNKALDELAYASIGQKFENVINAYDASIDQKTNRLLGLDGLESKIADFLAGRNIKDFSFASNPNWKDEVARELEAKRAEIEAMADGDAKDKALHEWEQTEKHYNEAIDLEKELDDLTKARADFIKDSRKRLEEELKAAEDLVDVYAALNRELEKIDRTIQRVEKDRKDAFGQGYLDTFDEELKALEKEDKTLTSINNKIETKRPKRQSDIQKSIDAASDGFKELGAVYDPETETWDLNTKFELKFDEEGFLENEEELRESANALVELYTSIAEAAQKAADEAKLAVETTVDDPTTEIDEQAEAKAAWDEAEAKVATANTNLDAVSNYVTDIFEKVDKANNEAKTYVDNAEKMADNARRWLEINFERWNYTLELGLEVNDRDLEMLEYKLGKIDDDIYSIGEAWTLTNQQIASHFTSFDVINQSYENLTNLFNAGQITPAKYAEGLKSIYSEAMEGAKSLDEIDEKMRTFYSDTLDLAIEQIDKYASALEHQTSVLEHYYNLITLINGEADYEKIGMILEGQAKTLENEMKFSTEQYQNAVNAQTEYQAFFDTLSDEDKKKYQANLDAINEQVREAEEEMLSDTEAWAEKLKEILENKMAEAGDILEKTFSGGMGFDSLNDSIDRLNDYQDIYLTKTNQVYEVQKLMRTAQQAADKTDNAAAKQRINNFVQETKKLQEKNKLSHLELEIQQAQYDMLMAQIALEEAKNAKTTVRLRRDSQGNFGYVYTADQEQVAKAEQELADAENRLYNISLEATNEWGQKRLELQQQYADAITELEERRANKEFETDEMYQQERDRITQEFYRNMEAYAGQYAIALNGHANTQADAWIRAYEDMMAESDKWNEATTQYLDANEKAYGEWKDEVAKNSAIVDGVLKNTQTEVQKVTDKSEELRKKGNEVAISMWTQVSAAQGAQKEYINLSRTVDDLRLDYLNMAAAAQSALDQISKINSLQMVNPYYTTYKNTNEDLSSLMTQHIVNGGQIGDMKWEALTQIRDEKIQANGNVSAFMTNAQIQQILSDYTNLKDSNPNALSVQWVNAILGGQAHYTPENYQKFIEELEKRNWIPGIKLFDTGGYTGEWGPQGRLAVVHEKELILKQDDTANFLLATGMLRNIASMIDLNAANSLLATGLQNPLAAAAYAPGTLDQNVTIEAHFPNATDRDEITEAFNTLINTASQYANRKTK